MIHLYSLLALALLTSVVAGCLWPLGRMAGTLAARLGRGGLAGFVIVAILLSALLWRPHEYTFQGLDTTGHRLMTRAFVAGRSFHAVDETLLAVPEELRACFLFRPANVESGEPITRDVAFRLRSLKTCETEPYFYPLLALCSAGFDLLVPGDAAEYLMPLMGILTWFAFAVLAASRFGLPGLLMLAAFWLASPVSSWFLRGGFPEAMGCCLVALGVWRSVAPPTLPGILAAGAAVSLSVAFHPLLIVIALPVLLFMVISLVRSPAQVVTLAVGAGLGIVPLVLETVFICSPYGGLSLQNLRFNWDVSASHRVVYTMAVVTGVAGLGLVALRGPVVRWLQPLRKGEPYLALLVAVVPVLVAMLLPRWRHDVCAGAMEWTDCVRGPIAILCGVILVLGAWSATDRRWLWLTVAMCAISPPFLFLKGVEQFGMWSFRRIFPVWFLAGIFLSLVAGNLVTTLAPGRWRRGIQVVVLSLVCGLCLSNAARWPDAYLVRLEHGAQQWIGEWMPRFANKRVVFDYWPYGAPFGVTNGPVLGIGGISFDKRGQVARWLAAEADTGTVWIVSAWPGPGMEEGMLLEEIGHYTFSLPKLRSKGALPAEGYGSSEDWYVLQVTQLVDGGRPPEFHKVMNGSPWGLRGPWGRHDISIRGPTGQRLSSAWSREGSGVIGPMPPPGGGVRVTMWASSGQAKPQLLTVAAPWPNGSVTLTIPAGYGQTAGVLQRPETATAWRSATGLYRLSAPTPYDPAREKMRGFDSDLGALIHRIDIQLVESAVTGPAAVVLE